MKDMTRREMLRNTALGAGGAASAASQPGIPDTERPLKCYPVYHAGRKRIVHPEWQREILSQTAVCYLRFLRKARVGHLMLPVVNEAKYSGRWVPGVPTHPAHLVVSVLDGKTNGWVEIRSIDLPPNPKFAGQGLSQSMSIEEMEDFFRKAVAEQPPHRIELGGVETDCLRVECDREHPVWPNHGECNGGPFHVPFGTLHSLEAYGEPLEPGAVPVYRPKLRKLAFSPSPPDGMTLDTRNPLEIVFRGSRMTIGFSLVRPMLTSLEWDYFGGGPAPAGGSRLFFKNLPEALGGLNGPSYIAAGGNFVPGNMTGAVEVSGNRVSYRDIETGCGVTVQAHFTVTAEAVRLELEQQADRDIPVLEGEAWRLVWSMAKGMTSVAGVPADREGRNGFVELPAVIAADRGGGLSVRLLDGTGSFHAESYRILEARSTGFVLAVPETGKKPALIPRGKSAAVFELKPCALLPAAAVGEEKLSEGVRKFWTAGFSAFRPEFGGFSNNAISTNCHVNQHTAFDFAAFTAKPPVGPDPIELVKFSIGRALLDGGGYCYHRSLYLDSDPILISGAGRVVQLSGDRRWLEKVGPGIVAGTRRILGNFDAGQGMILCRALSGNSGTHRWSSNAMDVIGFGHIDAYVNAWSFRALKNAATLLRMLGSDSLAARCAETAAAIAGHYARQLLHPETGWVSGWRSRDGRLHDYGFVWVNAAACAFGVVDAATARGALERIERKRREVFPENAYLGLPINLLPIAAADHMLPRLGYGHRPSFENYTDGALSPLFLAYYIRALSSCGLKQEAQDIVGSLERGYADGRFCGPYGTGKEFMTWNGADSGYEGTFGPNSGPLYAIAVEQGVLRPPDPEWWL